MTSVAVMDMVTIGNSMSFMRGFRKFCQGVHIFFFKLFLNFISLMRGGRIQLPLKAGHHQPAQRNAIQIAFRWWADDDPVLNAGLVAL